MTDLSQYEVDDPGFVDDLKNSDKHVDKVVSWLKSKGLKAKKRPIAIRDKVENMSDFSDDGDVDIVLNEKLERLEVKQRKLDFDSPESFPYETIIVDVAHTWDEADPKPFAYILTNKDCTACFTATRKSSQFWIRTRRWDRFKRRFRNFLECPVQHLKFSKIESQ